MMLTTNPERITTLCLSRKAGQSLWIGDTKVTLDLKGSVVKVVIEAPQAVRIVRDELRERAA